MNTFKEIAAIYVTIAVAVALGVIPGIFLLEYIRSFYPHGLPLIERRRQRRTNR